MVYRIERVHNVEGLGKALLNCRGRVELRTTDGNIINFKSELLKFMPLDCLVEILSNLQQFDFFIEKPTDAEIILQYAMGEVRKNARPHLIEVYN